MKKILIALATITSLIFHFEVKADELLCKNAIAEAGSKITGTGAVISKVSFLKNNSQSNPFTANTEVNFSLSSISATKYAQQKSEDVMNSSVIQRGIAQRIIKSCENVVKVNFGMNASDWVVSYFRGIDDKVIKGTCVDSPGLERRPEPLWGYDICL